MATPHRRAPWGLALLLGLCVGSTAAAQADRPWRLFRPADRPAKVIDPRRATEIAIEIAWLADPATFPYYLEARTAAAGLEVRGYVPDKAVHDQALNLARVHSSLPVLDGLKEHPSLRVRPTVLSTGQLQNSVTAALREALPRHVSGLKVQCAADGRVTVSGPVPSLEEKVVVSQALRRLHGCTSVQNQTEVPSQAPALASKDSPPEPAITENRPAPPRPWMNLPFIKTNQTRPADESKAEKPSQPASEKEAGLPNIVDGPPALVLPMNDPGPMKPAPPAEPKKTLTPDELQKAIAAACPAASAVRVERKSATELRVELTARAQDQLDALAGRVLGLPEMQGYRVELVFNLTPAEATPK